MNTSPLRGATQLSHPGSIASSGSELALDQFDIVRPPSPNSEAVAEISALRSPLSQPSAVPHMRTSVADIWEPQKRGQDAFYNGVGCRWENAQRGPPMSALLTYLHKAENGNQVELRYRIKLTGAVSMTPEVAMSLAHTIHYGRIFAANKQQPLERMRVSLGKTLDDTVVTVNGEATARCSGGAPNLYVRHRKFGALGLSGDQVLDTAIHELGYQLQIAMAYSTGRVRSSEDLVELDIIVSHLEDDARREHDQIVRDQMLRLQSRPTTTHGAPIPEHFLLSPEKAQRFLALEAEKQVLSLSIHGPMCYGSCVPGLRHILEQAGIEIGSQDLWLTTDKGGHCGARLLIDASDTEASQRVLAGIRSEFKSWVVHSI